jgi:carboxypeptidase C (cathepsin A)
MNVFRLPVIGFALVLAAAQAAAQPATPRDTLEPLIAAVVTHHAIELNGADVRYTATVGEKVLADAKGRPLATMVKDVGDLRIAGLILVSPMLDASATAEVAGNDLPHIFAFPSMAAAAWHHQRINRRGRSVERVYADAAAFAQGEYALALLKGTRLAAPDRVTIAAFPGGQRRFHVQPFRSPPRRAPDDAQSHHHATHGEQPRR